MSADDARAAAKPPGDPAPPRDPCGARLPDGRVLDALGAAHRPAGPDARIVSLVPSVTELLVELDLRDRLVGRTGFCIHPRAALRALPKVGGTKDIDLARLLALAPTHVVVNVDENPREAAEAIAARGVAVVATHPIEVEDNRALYALMGALFGREAHAARLVADFDAALARAARWPRRGRRAACCTRSGRIPG
jgi:ABC-type hemin transport system substrate-binding protein